METIRLFDRDSFIKDFMATVISCVKVENGETTESEKKAGEHHCGYTSFTMDISDMLIVGEENLIMVKVDSRESLNIPPFGNVIDYMTYGGIYRDVFIEVKEKQYMKDVFLHSDVTVIEKHGERIPDAKNIKICQWQTGEVFLYSKIQLNKQEGDFVIRQTLTPKATEECLRHVGESEVICF